MKWSLIRGLFREFGERVEGDRKASGTVLRDHVKNSNRTSREMGWRNDRRDGTLQGRIAFGWEVRSNKRGKRSNEGRKDRELTFFHVSFLVWCAQTLELLKKAREKGDDKFLKRLTEKVLFQVDAKGLAAQKERDRVKPVSPLFPSFLLSSFCFGAHQ